MKTQADVGIGPVSCENCSIFKKGEGGPEAPGALRLRNKKATASVASSYSQNPPVVCVLVVHVQYNVADERPHCNTSRGSGLDPLT